MLQFPAFMTQYPLSTRMIPTSFLLPSQWPQPHNEELLLAMEESEFEEKVISFPLLFASTLIISRVQNGIVLLSSSKSGVNQRTTVS